jgi:uncharacterized protein YceK
MLTTPLQSWIDLFALRDFNCVITSFLLLQSAREKALLRSSIMRLIWRITYNWLCLRLSLPCGSFTIISLNTSQVMSTILLPLSEASDSLRILLTYIYESVLLLFIIINLISNIISSSIQLRICHSHRPQHHRRRST